MQVYYKPRSVLTDQGEACTRTRVVFGGDNHVKCKLEALGFPGSVWFSTAINLSKRCYCQFSCRSCCTTPLVAAVLQILTVPIQTAFAASGDSGLHGGY